MISRDLSYLEDIRLYGTHAVELVGERDADAFASDLATRLAALHCLTLIGEAANHVSDGTLAALPDVPWSKVIGLRHVIVHHYRKVDLEEIWTIVTRDLPPVIATVTAYLADSE